MANRIAIVRRGQVVVLGTPDELKARVLGPRLFELRLAQPAEGLAGLLTTLVHVQAQGEDWLRFTTDDPRSANPRVLRLLAGHGVEVVTLSEVARSLEDVYLSAVQEGSGVGSA